MEQQVFFDSDGCRLFGMLHTPTGEGPVSQKGRPRAIILCHPFAEERTIAQRVLTGFSRNLCVQGYHVLRFDYRGTGDSEGDFSELTLTACLSDIRAAVDMMVERTGVRQVSLAGLRLGATLAALSAVMDERVPSLVMWEPVVEVRSYIDQFLRMQVIAENKWSGGFSLTRKDLLDQLLEGRSVDILGFHLGPKCFEECANVNFVQEAGKFLGKTLVVSIGSKQRQRSDLIRLVQSYRDHNTPVEMIQISERSFWIDHGDPVKELNGWFNHEGLFARTMEWLKTSDEETEACMACMQERTG